MFKYSFLWSKKKVNKYTKGREEKNQQYTNNLKNNRFCTICNIANYPNNQTEPNHEKINNQNSHYHVRIDPLENIGIEYFIHIRGL